MDEAPRVTIGLPVYNSERYVAQSIESLLAQSYANFELVISDNASTDTTPVICRRYAALDSRVRYHRNDSNIGNPSNFNRVFQLTTTPYLKWSTADDYWAPTFLEKAMAVVDSDSSIALCYPRAVLVDADGNKLQDYDDVLHLPQDDPLERFCTLIERIKLAHQHLGVIRMAHLRQTRLLRTHVGSDINLLSELVLYGKFYELPEQLFFRRFHKDSGSWKRGDASHEARRYHAANARRTGLAMWRRHACFFDEIAHSPLPPRAKLRAYRFLLRNVIWDRGRLADELVNFLRIRSAVRT